MDNDNRVLIFLLVGLLAAHAYIFLYYITAMAQNKRRVRM
jgi:hypothetical protein